MQTPAAPATLAAATFRGTDKRGGANGARIRLAPQEDWEVNDPAELGKVLPALEKLRNEFNSAQSGGKKVSLADLIVLGGCATVEKAATNAGHPVKVPFAPGRADASQEQTDAHSLVPREPSVDGFRDGVSSGDRRPAEEPLVARARLLTLTAPEITILVGGMPVVNANHRQTELGVFTRRREALTSDFFVNRLAMNTTWRASAASRDVFEGRAAETGHDPMDRQPGRPRLRFELPAPRPGGGPRV